MSSNKGLVFILSAPAGTGKTTVIQRLTSSVPRVVQSISYTSRRPRAGEIDGKDYFFVSPDEFQKKIENNDFLEWVSLYDQRYGTDRCWVEEHLKEGRHVFLVIDTQGALELKKRYPVTCIFLAPPSLEELQRRLRERKTETEEAIEKRLHWAREELARVPLYDYLVINDDLDTACDLVRSIVIAEEHRIRTP